MTFDVRGYWHELDMPRLRAKVIEEVKKAVQEGIVISFANYQSILEDCDQHAPSVVGQEAFGQDVVDDEGDFHDETIRRQAWQKAPPLVTQHIRHRLRAKHIRHRRRAKHIRHVHIRHRLQAKQTSHRLRAKPLGRLIHLWRKRRSNWQTLWRPRKLRLKSALKAVVSVDGDHVLEDTLRCSLREVDKEIDPSKRRGHSD